MPKKHINRSIPFDIPRAPLSPPNICAEGTIKHSLIKHRQVILYLIIGGSAAALDFFLFIVFYQSLHIQSAFATMASLMLSTVYGFLMNTFINFKTFDRLLRRFISYASISVLAALTSGLLLYIFTDTVGLNGIIVKALSLPLIAYAQYRMNRIYSFRTSAQYHMLPVAFMPPEALRVARKRTNTIDCTVIPPTLNEAKNIQKLIAAITAVFQKTPWYYEILFVDDSVDETPLLIEEIAKTDAHVRIIHREQAARTGLATAFVEGFEHARGDIICCMDADMQHPPQLISRLVETLMTDPNVSMAVASRYAVGGSEAGLDTWYRKIISFCSKFITHLFFPATKKTGDPMTGFFAFRRNILSGITLKPRGFKILVEMLVRISDIKVVDIPMRMQKRFAGYTKASIKEGIAFIHHLIDLARDIPEASIFSLIQKRLKQVFTFRTAAWLIFGVFIFYLVVGAYRISSGTVSDSLLTLALLQFSQGIFGIYLIVYAWDKGERIEQDSSPKIFADPKLSFSAIVPAKNEARVIGQTIATIATMAYPRELMETLVVLRDDDEETIAAARIAIAQHPTAPIRILLINGPPINKPHHLNAALKEAVGDVVCIFDAEDEPHPDIYSIVNTVMVRERVDVVQSGVQLMNFESNWYSLFNVLEYFLWFRSSLHFFAKQGLVPLGGTTVFFKRAQLLAVGGWDMACLTEDAEIGIRLSLHGAKMRVIYDTEHVTKEETPATLEAFIKQRTRWIQGFLQILKKPHWRKNQTLAKRLLTLYVICWPAVQAFLLLSIPFSMLLAHALKVGPVISLISTIPLLILVFFIAIQAVALYEFTRLYHKKWSALYVIKLIVLYLPYQLVLGISALRATLREIQRNTSWEKTEHIGAHRNGALDDPKEKNAVIYQRQ